MFGNICDEIENPRLTDQNLPVPKLLKRWCMYLSLDNDKEKTAKYIEKVIYYLHPSYKKSRISVD